jgi:opacity protein-like surface antigen
MKTFNKIIKSVLAAALLASAAAPALYADAAQGQKYYLKSLKSKFGMNGTKFAAQHTQDEWEELFEEQGTGFIEEYSQKYPKSAKFLQNPKNWKKLEHIRDFAVKYGSDSGNVPSCG